METKNISLNCTYLKDAHLFYKEFCHKDNTILYESAEIVDKSGVQSLIGARAALKISCDDLKVRLKALNSNGLALLKDIAAKLALSCEHDSLLITYKRPVNNLDENSRLKEKGPMDVLRALTACVKNCRNIFIGGTIAFDFINNFENIGNISKGENPCSDYVFYVFDIAIRINHQRKSCSVDAFVFDNKAYRECAFETLRLYDEINNFKQTDTLMLKQVHPVLRADPDDEEFSKIVLSIKQHIIDGDAFQVVPSRTFISECSNPLLAYSYLKRLNPSPYMYYIKDEGYTIFGASPEYALRYEAANRMVSISPIAGTRARGIAENGQIDRELDSRIELELRCDAKEVAEHLMLLDLARNDIARISKSASRYVDNMLHVDKYQSVMHLVSDVHGILRDDLDCFHAYCACMNMGTLSGAPKIKAHELIYRYEKKKRGTYGGTIAILSSDGSFDSCIAIRSAFVKNNTAYVQSGCGVVFDSDVKAECQETVNKAKSVLSAIAMAQEA